MNDNKPTGVYRLVAVSAAVIALLLLMTALVSTRVEAHSAAGPLGAAGLAAPAHESETAEPSETEHASHTPEATEIEHASHTPEATETEHASHTPEATETEHSTRTPEATRTDEASETPEATETEHSTRTPEATRTDEASETPEATETEHSTRTSEATRTEEASETPEATETEQTTETPEATETPEGLPVHLLTLGPRLQFGQPHPGDRPVYHFNLQNNGNAASQVTLGGQTQQGWTVSIAPAQLLLQPGASVDVVVSVQVPGAATAPVDVLTVAATDGASMGTGYAILLLDQRTFTDLQPQDWAYNPVQFLAAQNVIGGYADGSFRPTNTVTRAQFAKMLVNGVGWLLVQPPQPTFADVRPGDWDYAYVETAVQHGALAGYADGTFRPANNVTRAQLAKLIVTSRDWTLLTPATSTFRDVDRTNWVYSFVETAVDNGVLGGYADGTFHPSAPATRAQVAKILASGLVVNQDR